MTTIGSIAKSVATASVAAVVVALVTGCRGARLPVSDRTMYGTIYDTALEKGIRDGTAPLFIRQTYADCLDTLSEPAAIIGWNDGISTWEVFFATNRKVSRGEDRDRFGNGSSAEPIYGRAEVTVPKRRTGGDPLVEPERRWLPGGRPTPNTAVVQFGEVRATDAEQFLAGVSRQVEASRQKDLLVCVHGFNVDFDSAVVRAAQVALDMPFNGAVVAYAWPSQGGVMKYEDDEPINKDSVEPFAEFLTQLVEGVPADTKISIVVHSMGNRIVMQGLNRLPLEISEKRFANVVLCAPDVGLSDFEAWAPGVVDRTERVTLYASENDSALVASKGLHAEQRAGDAFPPVIAAGIETVDCSTVDYTSFLGHSYYSGNIDVLGDLFLLLKQDRDADGRPYLVREEHDSGPLWVFKQHGPRQMVEWHFEQLGEGAVEVAGAEVE
jgi:esterase/lipase superfamily enzyme